MFYFLKHISYIFNSSLSHILLGQNVAGAAKVLVAMKGGVWGISKSLTTLDILQADIHDIPIL